MKLRKILSTGLLVILIFPLISAIGVGSIYTGSESPLKLIPGEEKTIILELQNWDSEEDIILEGQVLKGADIAYLEGSKTQVSYQQKVNTKMIVKAPESAKVGDIYNVEYTFRQVPAKQEGGTLSFSQSLVRNFDVLIVSEPVLEPNQEVPASEKSSAPWVIGLIVLIAIILVAYFILKRK